MPSFCCVPGCSNDGGLQKGLSFHEFPTYKTLRKAWILAIRRDVGPFFQIIPGSTKICSTHFREEDFRQPSARTLARRKEKARKEGDSAETRPYRSLVPGAIPSQFPSFPEPPMKKARPPPKQRVQPSLLVPADSLHTGTEELSTSAGFDAISQPDMDASFSAESMLAADVASLQEQLTRLELENRELKSHVFCAERIVEDPYLLQFNTGFHSKELFYSCFYLLEEDAKTMFTWQGGRTKVDVERQGAKPGPPSKMNLLNQFFFTCVRIRRGLPLEDLADRFKVSASTLSRIFTTWINLMYVKFDELLLFPSRRKVDKNMPTCFKTNYPSTRIIIDCTEFFIQRPSSLATQSAAFSNYKNTNTCKLLVGISPDGSFTFLSDLYEGSISDRDMVIASGLLDKLERGDSVMADKGFEVEDLLLPRGVRLNIPPFMDKRHQMLPNDVRATKSIASVRIHVERAIGRLKNYCLLDGRVDNSLFDIFDRIVFVAAMLCNFQPGLAA